MRNSVSDVTDAEILDETREAMTQAAFDAADEASAAQAVEALHRNILDAFAALLEQLYALLYGEERILCAVVEHCHDQMIVDLCCALDNIKVSFCDRVERTGINCCCHRLVSSLSAVKSAFWFCHDSTFQSWVQDFVQAVRFIVKI